MRLIYTFLLLFVSAATLWAQSDTINSRNHKLRLENLKESKTTYLVYMADSLEHRTTTGDVWERETRFTTFNGTPVVEFTWKWYQKIRCLQ
ncbi:MAG TPA: hypothetical protein VF676_08830 [Flavobacterium sp.]